MIKRILKIVPKWTIASLLFFTQIHAQTDWTSPSCDSICETNECYNSFWTEADYLYWTIQNSPESTPLVIQDSTSVVLGGKNIDTGWRSGARAALGCWFDHNHCCGGEVNYFFLSNASKKYSVSSDGLPGSSLLAVPYFNVVTSSTDSNPIASPLLAFAGTAKLKLTNEMQGAELNALTTLPSFYCGSKFIVLTGFRFWNFREQLTFSTNSPFIPPHVADIYITKDEFNTKNNFYGGQLGLIWEYDWNCLSITAKGKVALGAMCESLMINGHLLTNDYDGFGSVLEYPGGYFALPTNIGKHTQTKFAAIPEFHFNVGYPLFDWMEIKLCYTFMYVSSVLWAGQQIDPNINPTQAVSYTGAVPPLLLGDASPKASLKTNGLWVQGLNVGLEIRF